MRRFLFNVLMAVIAGRALAAAETAPVVRDTTDSVASTQVGQEVWAKRVDLYRTAWNALMPDGLRLQTAGNMGVVSMGSVWIYGRNRQWETALTFGLVPKHQGNNAMATMTLKQDFIPWTVRWGQQRWEFQPLSAGVYLNTVFSSKFWTHQPHRYPRGYYWFSTRVRSNVCLGERLAFKIPDNRRQFAHQVKVFYELSTCDFYIIQAVKNDYITLGKILSLSLGVQFEWL